MKKYKTYQEAKIDNPERDIYKFFPRNIADDSYYFASASDLNGDVTANGSTFRCDPIDHCITMERLFDSGHELVDGDVYLDNYGEVCVVGMDVTELQGNAATEFDSEFYILQAKALEQKSSDEWVSGEECVYNGEWAIIVGWHPQHPIMVIDTNAGLCAARLGELSRPETKEAKVKREALELFNTSEPHNIHDVIETLSNAGMLKSKEEK